MYMRNLCIVFITLSCFIHTCFAKELFINSDPLNAEVYLGDDLIGKTPLRLGSVDEQNLKTLRIVKKGYEEVEMDIELDDSRSQLVYYTLYSPFVDLILAQREKDVFLNEVSAGKSPLIIKNIPNGIYQIESDENRITITNAEFERVKKTTLWETISTGLLFAGSLGASICYGNKDDQEIADLFLFSTVIFGGLLGYNLLKLGKIGLDEKRDRVEMSAIEISRMSLEADRDMFTDAMEYVGKEYWDDALAKFKLLVNLYPDSQYVPLGLYQIGSIYYSMGEYEQAARYLRSFVYEYPVPEFYAFAVHGLIDAELRRENPSAALGHYESLRPVYIDDPSGTLYQKYYDMFIRLYEENGSRNELILIDLLSEFDNFLNRYGGTYFYPDVLLLKGKLLYAYVDRDGGIELLNELKSDFSERGDIISEVDSILNAR
jgi:tetratricopeptide (TPR) repeat protein